MKEQVLGNVNFHGLPFPTSLIGQRLQINFTISKMTPLAFTQLFYY